MMKKYIGVSAIVMMLGFSSCGLFHKSCNCPHFGKVKQMNKPVHIAKTITVVKALSV